MYVPIIPQAILAKKAPKSAFVKKVYLKRSNKSIGYIIRIILTYSHKENKSENMSLSIWFMYITLSP